MSDLEENRQLSSETYLSAAQVAEELNVHPALIYKEVRAGRLPAVKIGPKVIRIARSALRGYLAGLEGVGAK